MSDPVRWLDGAPDAPRGANELLAAGRAIPPLSAPTKARVAARLAAGGAVSLLGMKALAAMALKSTSGKVIAVVATLGAATVATTTTIERRHRAEPVRTTRVSALAPRPQISPLPAPPVASLGSPPEASTTPAVRPPPARRPHAPRSEAIETPATISVDLLRAEAALLEEAREILERQPRQALVHLSRHAKEFRDGHLTAERKLLTIEALTRLGKRAQARKLARGFLAEHGQGVYSERVERLLQRK